MNDDIKQTRFIAYCCQSNRNIHCDSTFANPALPGHNNDGMADFIGRVAAGNCLFTA
jgi:hypothetical protein